MSPAFQEILQKIQAFKKKYYLNKILKGLILSLALLLITYLLFVILEYFGQFNARIRSILFYSFIIITSLISIFYILNPISLYLQIRKNISGEEAAKIIGQHVSEIDDKLLNTLQLESMLSEKNIRDNRDLILMSIEQKSSELRIFPFMKAIDLKQNKKYLPYFIVPFLCILLLLFISPSIVREPTKRIVAHNTEFEKLAPFSFILKNDSLKVIRNRDFEIMVKLEGNELPDKLMLNLGKEEYMMKRIRQNEFRYLLRNVNRKTSLYFRSGKYKSRIYNLEVLPDPKIRKFQTILDFPDYTGKQNMKINNIGDLNIPAGTKVTWNFFTADAENLLLLFTDTTLTSIRKSQNEFYVIRRFLSDNQYTVSTSNQFVQSSDSLNYMIKTIPDAFPQILLRKEQDSISNAYYFFDGEISDDYGLVRLEFVYRFTDKDSNRIYREIIPIGKNALRQVFYYSWNLNTLKAEPGSNIEFYFEVWDNDGINGSKSSRSQRFIHQLADAKEIREKSDALSNELNERLENAARQSKEIQEELDKARKKLLEKKKLSWEEKKYLEDVLKQQKELEKEIEQIKEKFVESAVFEDDNRDLSPELLERFEELYKMFDELLPEDVKNLYEELNKLMQENMDKDILNDLEKMQMNNKDLEKELERMQELFKQLKFDQKTDALIEDLKKLAEKQDELSEESLDKEADQKELQEKQEKLNEEFDQLSKEFDDLEKLNNELEEKAPFDKMEGDQKDIKTDQEEGLQNLENKKNKKASENQRSAAAKMKKMAEKLEAMKAEMEEQSLELNYKELRQILDNLLYVSFEQEQLMKDFEKINSYNPQYVEYVQKQRQINENTSIIEDSLYSLSKKVPMIQAFINQEMTDINNNIEKTVKLLSDRDLANARQKQHLIMTSMNNLAVLLSDILKQMQQEMSMKKSGKQSGKKKKGQGGKPDISHMKKLQEQLNKQIEELKKQSGAKGQKMSRDLARMAAQQEQIRNMLRELEKEKTKEGNKPGKNLKEIQDLMEKTEEDLVNKRITNETLKRQKEITIKLLEAEKAEREQEKDKKRESRSARDIFDKNPPSLEEYQKQKQKEVELLETVPPSLNDFYKEKVRNYFRLLRE